LNLVWRVRLFEYHRNVARLGLPVDRKEWCMYPQTVNAVNLPLQNALNFPAGILQPPYFNPQARAAVNYGAIGATIGHEISHTFDTQGSVFDSKGRMRNWWKPADLAHFNAATARLAAQYDTDKPFPDLAVNGRQTLGEDIADLGGISAAYDAYRASLAGKTTPVQNGWSNGFSGDQQFFLAFAQSWRSKSREAALRRQVMTQWPPDEFRAVTVRNLDAWYAAFDVQPGEKLYLAPADRVHIWYANLAQRTPLGCRLRRNPIPQETMDTSLHVAGGSSENRNVRSAALSQAKNESDRMVCANVFGLCGARSSWP
jgi:endothelin-converting enzyme/putative endopeptidase